MLISRPPFSVYVTIVVSSLSFCSWPPNLFRPEKHEHLGTLYIIEATCCTGRCCRMQKKRKRTCSCPGDLRLHKWQIRNGHQLSVQREPIDPYPSTTLFDNPFTLPLSTIADGQVPFLGVNPKMNVSVGFSLFSLSFGDNKYHGKTATQISSSDAKPIVTYFWWLYYIAHVREFSLCV